MLREGLLNWHFVAAKTKRQAPKPRFPGYMAPSWSWASIEDIYEVSPEIDVDKPASEVQGGLLGSRILDVQYIAILSQKIHSVL